MSALPVVAVGFVVGPHHDGSALYVPEATPSLGDVVPVRIRVPRGSGVQAVHARFVRDGEPGFSAAVLDETAGSEYEDWYVAEVPMQNPVVHYRFLLDRGTDGYTWLNAAGEYDRDVPDSGDFRLTTHDGGPDWALDDVVYQVFPDRFAQSGAVREAPDWAVPAGWTDTVVHRGPDTPRQFFGGDLDGIREHLDHLAELGATTLYLTPIFPARSNHRYNASSFDGVDPLLGGDEALVRLADEVHRRGLRILGDLTTNHSGDDHPWFAAASAAPDAAERGYYYFADDGSYASWLGVHTLPKFNLASDALRELMFGTGDSVVARWLREPFALDGWRIDVANMTGRYGAADHLGEVARQIRDTIGEIRPDAVLLAEHAHDATGDLAGDGWQGTMNYAGFTRPLWSWLAAPDAPQDHFLGVPTRIPRRPGGSAVATMREFASRVPWKVTTRNWNLLGSHDTARFRTITGDPALVAVGVGLLMTYPGTPMVFAGDELGLQGVDGEDSRRPMPWDRPDEWDTETLAVYRELIALRRSCVTLRRGGLRWVLETDDAIGYLRETADEGLLVVASRSPWSGAVLPRAFAGAAENLYGGTALTAVDDGLLVPGDGPGVQVWRLLG